MSEEELKEEGPQPFRPAVVIPCYNHGRTLRAVLEGLAPLRLPCLVVDDGSDAENRAMIDAALEGIPYACAIHRETNGGKGAAVMTGIEALAKEGCTHALQVDADGQHDLRDAPKLIAAAKASPAALVSGRPVYDASAPAGRKFGRLVTQFWVALETLSLDVKDSMCGFRVYPVVPLMALFRKARLGERMDFDIEVLVRLHWAGVPMVFIPTRVIYPEGGLSHFDYVKDNVRISKMHTRLVLEAPAHWLGKLTGGRSGKAEAVEKAGGGSEGAGEAAGFARTSGWAGAAERGGAAGIRILLWLYRRLGRRAFGLALRVVILFYWATGGAARKASAEYLARVTAFAARKGLPEIWSEHPNTYRHFLHFGYAMLDRIAAWQGDFEIGRDLVFEGRSAENLAARQGARGKLLLTSHFGVAEVCRALAEGEREVPVTAILFEGNAKRFRRALESLAPGSRPDVVALESIDIGTAARLSEKIERGEWVAIAADRTPPVRGRTASRVVWAEFLGRKAPFPVGPYVLASLLECEVCTLFAVREGGAFRVRCDKFEDRISLPRKGREAALAALACRFAKRLEVEVLAQPLEWFNFYDFWSDPDKRPGASDSRG